MNNLYILKLGGSIVTYKDSKEFKIRVALLEQIARELKIIVNVNDLKLIIVHGAGSYGHVPAKLYGFDKKQDLNDINWLGALKVKSSVQELNTMIIDIFLKNNLPVFPIHSSSIVKKNKGAIDQFFLSSIEAALDNNLIPVLYGDMVFDVDEKISICSGDQIVPYIANQFKIEKIFYATDVDGVFDIDPYVSTEAKLIREVEMNGEVINMKADLTSSHNKDVTDGLRGKVLELFTLKHSTEVCIFNGLRGENFELAMLGKLKNCTKIKKT